MFLQGEKGDAEFLVSTYVVCERLSVKQVLAAVVEILVKKTQFTPSPPRIISVSCCGYHLVEYVTQNFDVI